MGMTERVKDGRRKGIFGYKDESGGLIKDETNGAVNDGRNERKRGWNEGDDPANADEQDVSDEIEEEKPMPKKRPANRDRQQTTLDAHVGKGKIMKRIVFRSTPGGHCAMLAQSLYFQAVGFGEEAGLYLQLRNTSSCRGWRGPVIHARRTPTAPKLRCSLPDTFHRCRRSRLF
jgi:hypothetical protein